MKLGNVLLLGLIITDLQDIQGMLGGEVKKAAEAVYPGAKNLNDAFNGLVLGVGAHFEEIIEALLSQVSEDGIDKFKNSFTDFLEAPQGSTLPQAINHFKNGQIRPVKDAIYRLQKKIVIAGASVSAVILTYYLMKRFIHFNSLNVDNLKKSNLLAESSGFANGFIPKIVSLVKSKKTLKKLILSSAIVDKAREVLKDFIAIIRNLRTNANDLRFKSLLLNGPKGTGKTLFVDHLIKLSNVAYIKINSTSFINFDDGTASVELTAAKALTAFFNLIKKPKREIIVVIEELDILLNQSAYKDKLMVILKWLKSNNHKFILIACAENKALLDDKLLALIDQNIEFTLPGVQERRRFLLHNIEILLNEHHNTGLGEIVKSVFNVNKIEEIANKTDGFSYSKLELLIGQFKIDLLKNNDQFTKELVNNSLQKSLVLQTSLSS